MQVPISAILAIAVLFGAMMSQASAESYTSPYLMGGLTIRNTHGDVLQVVQAGQQVVLEFQIKKFYQLKDYGDSIIAITEIRDSNGFTVYLSWQTVTAPLSEVGTTGVSWLVPNGTNNDNPYEVRFFLLTSIENPEALSMIVPHYIKLRE